MDVNSDFQKKIVEYLESLCVGEFINGPKIDISERVGEASESSDYRNPTCTLPVSPPTQCTCTSNTVLVNIANNVVE